MKQTLELGLGLGVNLLLVLLLVLSISCCTVVVVVDAKCSQTCDLALASYYLWQNSNVTFVRNVLQSTNEEILAYNPSITNIDSVQAFSRLNVPFTCGCLSDQSLGHLFTYMVSSGDTYEMISGTYYSKLTTVDLLTRFNSYDVSNVPVGVTLNVPVPCSCGNAAVSKDYGLFLTYPLRENETLASVASNANVTEDLVQRYNPNADFSEGSGILYIPARDSNGLFVPLKSSTGLNSGAIAGISIAAVAAAVILAVCIFLGFLRKKKVKDSRLLSAQSEDRSPQHRYASGRALVNTYGSTGVAGGTSAGLSGITVDKSVEFSYDELATASDNFSLANKIGQGGFGAVYYAELRGEKAAIKKMDMQASKEFLAELKVLTNVHHLNLVRLIGYCVEGSLFLVYEYIENGNLSQHLRGSEREPLSWSTRLQIALDSARGLEYIHEHTVPVYIHRDIKTANILIDKNYHGKVADFGLTKLTEIGGTSLPTRNVGTSLPTRIVGTFGYMPPEYAQYGEVSPKVDVYAFGVVLYELISAKEAIVRMNGPVTESKGLVAMFEEVLNQPDPKDDLVNMIDPRMGDNYPFDSVKKMAQLAKACTQENPQLRPSMRSIVVALMTLSSTTEDWDVGSFYENQALVNLMSGR